MIFNFLIFYFFYAHPRTQQQGFVSVKNDSDDSVAQGLLHGKVPQLEN